MGIDNYETLGFQVNIDGADTVETHLGKIVKRLEKIQQLNKALGNIGGKSGQNGGIGNATTKEKLSEEEKYEKRVLRQKELLKSERYKHLRAIELENQALKRKISYDALVENQAVRNAEIEARVAQAKSQAAISTQLLSNETYKQAIAQKTVANYQEQQIRQMATLQAEQKALNDGKWEEARRIELANNARKKEIDQRLKQQLGLKDTTNGLGLYISKMFRSLYIARRLGRVISSAIQESASYVENLNLFAVAYGDVYQETLDWALDLADGFGLASNEVLKFAGTFRQLSISLGLVEDTANSVSQTVTQLGFDISALFNTSVENAMEKLQSGLFSGNVRPLRAYGIDISQNQIDALFETNQALASLGVNARNLSQSDKVLARLIITLRDGSNAFGTMNREINTLQSQIRILQGSFSNFKLAIGDLLYEPTRQTLILLNALIIAATNVIRVFAPMKKTDENNVFNGVAMGAEEANNEIDELNGKLADFDKFNVLGGQSQDTTSSAITEALTAELAKQQEYYAQQVDLMDDIENEAKELSKALEPVVVLMTAITIAWAFNKIATTKKFINILSTGVANLTGTIGNLNKSISWTSVLLVAGIIYAVVKAVEAFRNGEYWAGVLAVVIATGLTVAWIALNREMIKTMGLKIGKFFTTLIADFKKMEFGASGLLYSFGALTLGLSMFLSNFNDMSNVEKAIGIFGALAGALTGVAIAFHATHNWAKALMVGATVAGGMLMVSSITSQLDGYADGGYTNANLIMTHENGKREWVGKAAGSSAIVNDTQMSDIMEVAVAKGVVLGNRALGSQESGGGVIHNHIYLDGKQIYEGVTDTAKKYGKKWANA